MVNIHTFGDSHATHYGGWGDINIDGLNIYTNHIIGKLAFSFGRDEMIVVNSSVKENDVVVFCFGEIDCRCHINKYEPNWKESIDEVVNSYITNVKRNVNNRNIKTCVYNVVPPLERENTLNKWTEEWANKHGVPATGTDEDRKRYSEYMNLKLKEACDVNGFVFLDVYDKYCDENRYLKRELSDTNCHVKNPIYISEFIKNNLL
jgi:hypothetical protein